MAADIDFAAETVAVGIDFFAGEYSAAVVVGIEQVEAELLLPISCQIRSFGDDETAKSNILSTCTTLDGSWVVNFSDRTTQYFDI